ncbi:MAG: hypothetical protein A3F16_00095 [Deltaproteobacteria bacterium RIFCSPHIGHO2_12_FULL_43_9]|nr:MAG: hypothetical protein A3F16_00095 [Deltaproteobacteria bacterium RIFCSPHIGHO2_12_FULL_43_9]
MKKSFLILTTIISLFGIVGCGDEDPPVAAGPSTSGGSITGACGAAFPIYVENVRSVPISSEALPPGAYDYIGADLYIDKTRFGYTERWQIHQEVTPLGAFTANIACTFPNPDINDQLYGSMVGMYSMYVSPEGRHDLQLQEYFVKRDFGRKEPIWSFGAPVPLRTTNFNSYVGLLADYSDNYYFFQTDPDHYEYRASVEYRNYFDNDLYHLNIAVRLKFTPLGRGPRLP